LSKPFLKKPPRDTSVSNLVTEAVYWFDDQFSQKNTQVANSSILMLSTDWTTDSLNPGFHWLHFYFKDSYGSQSSTKSVPFYRRRYLNPGDTTNIVTAVRYWLDNGSNPIQTIDLSGGAPTTLVMEQLDMSTLSNGPHILHLQFKQSNGLWSSAYTDTFNLALCPATYRYNYQTALGAYTWPVNGLTYSQSGTYRDTLVNSTGCDSIITLSLTILPGPGLPPDNNCLQWANSAGGTGFDRAYGMATDGSGNVYTAGVFRNTAYFGSGTSSDTLASTGNVDIFIQKQDPSGNLLWVRQIGGASIEYARDLAVDGSGNVYVTGEFQGSVDFDPGPQIHNLTSAGSNDYYVLKLDASGNFLWAVSGGGSDLDGGTSIAVNPGGGVYITGGFWGTSDLDPGPGVASFTSDGFADAFILKLDASGNFIWARKMGGPSRMRSASLASDPAGNVYATGWFEDSVDFDPGVGVQYLTATGLEDIFILKLDSGGNLGWAHRIGSSSHQQGEGITTDPYGGVYVTGRFRAIVDFDPGPGMDYINVTSGGRHAFVIKMDTTGSLIWGKGIQGTSSVTAAGFDVAVDSHLNVYTTGLFSGSIDFDPGPGTYTLNSGITHDIYVQKLDFNGNFIWANQVSGNFPSVGSNHAQSIATGSGSDVVISGYFQDTADFDPGPDQHHIGSVGNDDIFIQKLGVCGQVQVLDTLITCDSYTWPVNNGIYDSSGVYTDTLHIIAGMDTIRVLDLTINHSTTGTDVLTACDSLTWIDGITYYTDNDTATYRLTNAVGCDSIVTLDLTINSGDSVYQAVTACNSYQWLVTGATYLVSGLLDTVLTNTSGCDSLLVLDLTLNYSDTTLLDTAVCSAYFWPQNGLTYYNDGTYYEPFTDINGCPSYHQLNLTILQGDTVYQDTSTCNTYLWPVTGSTYLTSGSYDTTLTNTLGCDSVMILNLIINHGDTASTLDTVACNNYLWSVNSMVYDSSGTYFSSFIDTNACTSYHRLDLTVYYSDTIVMDTTSCNLFVWNTVPLDSSGTYFSAFVDSNGCTSYDQLNLTILEIDTSLSVNGIRLTSNQDNAAWQWINCQDSTILPGDTNQFFEPSTNGSYAVVITTADCVDTSRCVAINSVGISDEDMAHNISLFPNPAQDVVHVRARGIGQYDLILYNDVGQLLFKGKNITDIDLNNLASGVYFVRIQTDGMVWVGRVIKKDF
ncbi:MAG TPA: hypothetical protein DCG19_14675, partial [Cryomorphaceae bacterium]|nr:hypothetical protein [Cryomorphaceae bacterium]